MLVLCNNRQLSTRIFGRCHRYLATKNLPATKSDDSEYSEVAQYPEILDLSFKAKKDRLKQSWREEIRNVPSVEEKLIKINMPRYYGYKVLKIGDEMLPYNCLPMTQHYTRTVFEEIKDSESIKPVEAPQLESFVNAIKTDVQDGIELVHDVQRQRHRSGEEIDPVEEECKIAQLIVEQVHRSLVNSLVADCPYLQEAEVDYNPRHEAFWAVGGVDPPKNVVNAKKGRSWQKEMANDPVDRLIQYIGQPFLAVRHSHQLPTWKNESESVNIDLAKQIPRYNYDPRTLGYSTDYRHATNIPGFWPGSKSVFGCISYQSRAHMLNRPESFGEEDNQEALHAQGIQSSYAWLLASANYNGFNTYNDLTYPMNTQTIITNGRLWSFYEYQLHTLLVHSNHVDDNPIVNFCRGTRELQLYQEIDEKGKCVGFNEEVLRHLVQFYVNAPKEQRTPEELQPYLDQKHKYIADYDDVDKREFLEKTFKHLMSNRKRHLELPEIYLWEKIYKIDNKTRPMEARRRYYELDINPWKRTLDQHQKVYIPRQLRPEGPKSRKKWKQTYYP